MSDEDQTSLVRKLPNEIISEILTRLPAKSVTRFKFVSKTWNSIISTPKFICSYISHNSPSWVIFNGIEFYTESDKQVTRFNTTLVNPPNITTFSINPHLLLTTDQVFNPDIPILIFTSSNGLLLFSLFLKRDPHKEHEKNPDYFSVITFSNALFVGNPFTREWVPLPVPIQPMKYPGAVGLITRLDSNGVVDKFLVVEYQTLLLCDFSSFIANFLCFSSDTGKWDRIATDYMLGLHNWRTDGVFEFANRLVWYDLRVGLNVWDEDPFDFMESKKEEALCRFVSLPNGCRMPSGHPSLNKTRSVYGNGGFIQYLEVFEGSDNVLTVWSLMGFGLPQEEWSLMYNVGRVDFESCGLEKSLPCVCFGHPFEVDVFFLEIGGSVYSYNFRTRKVEKGASLSGREQIIPVVIPSWPTSVPSHLYAVYAKERGNQCFKDKNFMEAIKNYSKSITLSPNALAFANRAMAYIKVGSFHEAEKDSTDGLNLDTNYFKLYGRRALARKELGNFEGCLEDIEYALKLEPKNKEMIKQHDDIKSLIKKESMGEYDLGGPACNVEKESADEGM